MTPEEMLEEYKRTYGFGTPTGADTAMQGKGALQRAYEAVMEPIKGFVHVAEAPARALNAYSYNRAETGRPISVLDSAIYGRDMNTGKQAPGYGDILAGSMEDSGEIAPGGKASRIIAAAGNMVTDPGMAAPMMSAAEGAGALAGRLSGGAPPGIKPPRPRRAASRLHPSYKEPPPSPKPVKVDMDATQPVRTFRPTDTQSIQALPPEPVIKYKPRLQED